MVADGVDAVVFLFILYGCFKSILFIFLS